MSEVKINQVDYGFGSSKGRIAVFFYTGDGDPESNLDKAVSAYVGQNGYHELVDSGLNNPWMRVVISDINLIQQKEFIPGQDKIDSPIA